MPSEPDGTMARLGDLTLTEEFVPLCVQCQSIFHNDHDTDWLGKFHESHADPTALERAATSGCGVCTHTLRKFWEEFTPDSRYGTDGGPETFKYSITRSDVSPDTLEFVSYCVGTIDDVEFEPLAAFVLIPSNEIDSSARPTAHSNNSVETWNLCRHWLDTCRVEHSICRSLYNSSFRPSRLIHVAKKGGCIRARLDCDTERPQLPYLTLSHRWGDTDFFKLTSKKLQTMQEDIDISMVRKSMQDAFTATLELGVEYIWIDSLCILQDSTDDWLKESAQMGDIYRNACCNVAVTGFQNVEQGLFVQRDPVDMEHPKVKTRWSNFSNYPQESDVYLVDGEFWGDNVLSTPLNERGWVLQERLLSPCILHFGSHQVFWECSESDKCEQFPDNLPSPLSDTTDRFKSMLLNKISEKQQVNAPAALNELRSLDLDDKERTPYLTWHSMVQHYSKSGLTRPSDRLIALSGVAKEVRRILNDRYLCGLWYSNLLRDLLWYINPNEDSFSAIPSSPRAPTWSWASLDGDISYDYAGLYGSKEETLHASVQDAYVCARDGDDTTMVDGGCIRIKGPLIAVHCLTTIDGPDDVKVTWDTGSRSVEVNAYFDFAKSAQDKNDQESMCRLRLPDENIKQFKFGSVEFNDFMRQHPFYLLPIQTTDNAMFPPFELNVDPWAIAGLVLSLNANRKGQHVRVGTFLHDYVDTNPLLLPTAKLSPGAYEECDDSGDLLQYTFTIM